MFSALVAVGLLYGLCVIVELNQLCESLVACAA